MIVNNDPDTMVLLQRLLQLKGYTIQSNARVQDLSKMLKDFKPGPVLLDISQQTVFDIVKSDAENEKIPTLLITGQNNYTITKNDGVKDFIKCHSQWMIC